MQQFVVPQFIEVEDKIIGPLTLRQFIYLAGGAGLCIVIYLYLPFILAALLIVPIGGLAAALSFYKINNKPFAAVLESAFSYYTRSKLFLWKREETPAKMASEEAERAAIAAREAAGAAVRNAPRLTSDKLHELAWSLDVKNRDNPAGDDRN